MVRDIINPTIKDEKVKGILDSKDHKKRLCELVFKYWSCPKIGYFVSVLNANPQATNIWPILRKLIVELMNSMKKKGLSIGFEITELNNIIDNGDIKTLQKYFTYEFDDDIKTEEKHIKEKDLLIRFNDMNKTKYNLKQ